MQKSVFSYIMLFISRDGLKENKKKNRSLVMSIFLSNPHRCRLDKVHRLTFSTVPHRSVGTTQVSRYHTGQWVPHRSVGTTQVSGYHRGQ